MSARLVFVVALLSLPRVASADDTYWLWAIDGRYERSKKPCATSRTSNPAQLAIVNWIGDETFVRLDADGHLSLMRGPMRVSTAPDVSMVTNDGEPVGLWRQGARTWIVVVKPRVSPAFITVTLVMEKDASRSGPPKCYERWIAPVSP